MAKNWRIGVDVGGTNTDAVIIDENLNLVAEIKCPTTADVMTGIKVALQRILAQTGVDKTRIGSATLGTTHCTNAIIERKRLNKAAIIRIGAPATTAIEPLTNWPEDLLKILNPDVYIVKGGHEFNGQLISDLDENRILEIAHELKEHEIEAVAVSSVFSTVNDAHEKRAAELVKSVIDVPITISSEVGFLGLLERENAAMINAILTTVGQKTADGFAEALRENGLDVKVYMCQNDGTVMSVEYAKQFPVLTIACGPTNSIRGGSFLSKMKNAIIVDVGGTTTDVGVLMNEFPRESLIAVDIGEIRTNFRMPDVHSLGLGGGSIVRLHGDEVSIGPDSVGFMVTEKALCFGGDVFTATDVAVGLGMTNLGDKSKINVPRQILEKVAAKIKEKVEICIDSMKTSAKDELVILVGGGSIILPESLIGASRVIKPEHFGVANAIGAAISQVSGSSDKIFQLTSMTRDQAVQTSKALAVSNAKAAGADPETVRILSVEEVPLAYLGGALKIRSKAVGELLIQK